ncbi:hypothetical protein [uncultured Thiodictyon sp.]|uniref:hypothetical protein n=1 Tax=uncultured Thiodictyon sp. TaxID=1846217 RepID=UPI0025F2FD38|nr:hypothetical protein [uncultured Thiodictyon sp.]
MNNFHLSDHEIRERGADEETIATEAMGYSDAELAAAIAAIKVQCELSDQLPYAEDLDNYYPGEIYDPDVLYSMLDVYERERLHRLGASA